jgi:hypothetical protein
LISPNFFAGTSFSSSLPRWFESTAKISFLILIASSLRFPGTPPRPLLSSTSSARAGARSVAALPDGGFLRKICKILADLIVVWQAKNNSGGLPISGGFLTDLTNFAWVCFCLADSGGFGVSVSKTTTFLSLFLPYKKKFRTNIFMQNITKKKKYFQKINKNPWATSEIRQNPH